jgi:hypothetical protein
MLRRSLVNRASQADEVAAEPVVPDLDLDDLDDAA